MIRPDGSVIFSPRGELDVGYDPVRPLWYGRAEMYNRSASAGRPETSSRADRSARTDEPSEPNGTQAGKLVREIWDAAYVNDVRAGYVHFTLREITRPDGMKFLRAAKDLSLSLRRGGDVARIQATTGTDETADGQV